EGGRPRLVGRLEGAAVDALEAIGAVEGRQRDLRQVDGAAVRISADHATLVVDRYRLQLARGKPVLLQQIDLDVAVRVGELRDAARAVHDRHRTEWNAVDGNVR